MRTSTIRQSPSLADRLPRGLSRLRVTSPGEASIGALPHTRLSRPQPLSLRGIANAGSSEAWYEDKVIPVGDAISSALIGAG